MLHPNIPKFKLGFWTPSHAAPSPSDARSLSRLFGPFNAMQRQDRRLEVVRQPFNPEGEMELPTWDYVSSLDCLYLLDPFTQHDMKLAAIAKSVGTRLWVDYIDDLQNVPPSNPHFLHFADKELVRANMKDLIEAADIATTTTFTLKCRLPGKDKVALLPEACRWPMCHLPRERVITWRGSPSHAEDIESVLPAIASVAAMPQFSLWKWVFFGFERPDWRLAKAFPNPAKQLDFVPWLGPYEFVNEWGARAPYLHLSPIVDNAFNRAKTPLAWLEASAIGAACIGPALPEWNACKGLLRYQTPAEFGEILKAEMFKFRELETPRGVEADPYLNNLHPAAVESRAAIYPKRTLPAVNEIRWKILNALAGAPKEQEAVAQ